MVDYLMRTICLGLSNSSFDLAPRICMVRARWWAWGRTRVRWYSSINLIINQIDHILYLHYSIENTAS